MARRSCATFMVALSVFAMWSGLVQAEEIRGKIAKLDADKNQITITFPALPGAVPLADQTFEIPKQADLVDLGGKDIRERLKDKRVKEGVQATITLEKKDGKVTKVKIHVDPEKK